MKNYSKAIAALFAAVGVAVANGLIPPSAVRYVDIAIAFATALGVYLVPNKPAAPTP